MTEVDTGSAPPGQAVGRRPAVREIGTRELVLAVSAVLVAAQVAFRAWALYPSWFYNDDYQLLSDATRSELDLHYLGTPFYSQFMPVGRAIAWWVAHSGHVNWPLTATTTLALQLVASVACLWMLTTLFGIRWAILPPLVLYLTCAIGLPAVMWWAAALNQLPLQVALFLGVASWVRYLRCRRLTWLAVTLAVVALGLLAYVKALLVPAVLCYLVLAHFSSGPPRRRVFAAVRTYWPAAVAFASVAAIFTAFYLRHVPSVFEPGARSVAGGLFDTMVGTAFASGVVGGPWRWNTSNPPVGYAQPPNLLVHLAWVGIVLTVVVIALLRVRTLRAWMLLAGYLGAAYLLLLTSRAPLSGPVGGLEYRYLTDVVPVLALSLALATMHLRGAQESSAPRAEPLLRRRPPSWSVAMAVAIVAISSTVSSAAYARIWHEDNPGARYTHAAMAGLRGLGEVDLADQVVPPDVISGFSAPFNTTGHLLPLLVDNARFPESTPDLVVLDEEGKPRTALIDAATTSTRRPRTECGWRLRDRGTVTIPLQTRVFDVGWWVRIGYLASAEDRMTVRAGDVQRQVEVSRGLHSAFLRVTGGFDAVSVGGLGAGTTVCVDKVEVGNPVPGRLL